ncbi:MAG: JAB domain-containing protein [Kiritimatiellia bacterium]
MNTNELSVVETAAQAAAIFRAELPREQKEERVWVLPLDANGRVLAKPILVSVGHQDGTAAIDVGVIFREALKAGAEEIIVAHNHPSDDLMPSKADIETTRRLEEAARLLNVNFLDHLIIGAPDSVDGMGFVSILSYCGS